MNLFKQISHTKRHIDKMKKQIPYIKNRDVLENHVATINIMIQLINDMETYVDDNLNSDVMERMLFGRFYKDILRYYERSKDVPVQYIFDKIMSDVELPVDDHKRNIIHFMQDKQRDAYIRTLPLTGKDINDVINTTIDTSDMDEIERSEINYNLLIGKITPPEVYNDLLNELLTKFQFGIQFN